MEITVPTIPKSIPQIPQKTEVKITNPTPPVNVSNATKPPSSIPSVPKGVPIPPAPKIPLNKIATPSKPKPSQNTLTLEEEIKKGVKLKKVVTVEKTGIDYLKKRDNGSISTNKPAESTPVKTEVKGDIFAEMRKVQLKKIQK